MSLEELAKQLREHAEPYQDYDMTDKCEEMTEYVCMVLEKLGYQPSFVVGFFLKNKKRINHCWVEVNQTIIDLTIDQFGDYSPGIISKVIFQQYFIVNNKINRQFTTNVELGNASDIQEHMYLDFIRELQS